MEMIDGDVGKGSTIYNGRSVEGGCITAAAAKEVGASWSSFDSELFCKSESFTVIDGCKQNVYDE
jgi:hypothetical protein